MLLGYLALFLQPTPPENHSWEYWICLSLKFSLTNPLGWMGKKKKKSGRENWGERESTTHQIRSLGCFLKVIFIPCRALIQINSQLLQLLTCMPELWVWEEADQKHAPQSSDVSTFPNANHLLLLPYPRVPVSFWMYVWSCLWMIQEGAAKCLRLFMQISGCF